MEVDCLYISVVGLMNQVLALSSKENVLLRHYWLDPNLKDRCHLGPNKIVQQERMTYLVKPRERRPTLVVCVLYHAAKDFPLFILFSATLMNSI